MKKGQTFALGLFAAVLLAAAGCETESRRAYDAPEDAARSVTYDMSGSVSEIDRDSGVLSLRGEKAVSKVPFDTADMREIKEGDRITAHLTLTKVGSGARAHDAPEMREIPPAALPRGEGELGRRDITGTIGAIDHGKGDITINTGDAEITLNLPASAIRGFEEGDRVTVRASFSRLS